MRGFPPQCARCGGIDLEVVAGEELLVDALEIEQGPLELAGPQKTTTGG
jgi:hypothetical protein